MTLDETYLPVLYRLKGLFNVKSYEGIIMPKKKVVGGSLFQGTIPDFT